MCRHVFHVLFVYYLKSNCNQIVISRLEFIFSEPNSTKKHSVIVYKYNIAHKISHYNTKYIIILYHIIVVLFCVTLFCVILYYFVLYCSPGIPYPPWSPDRETQSHQASLGRSLHQRVLPVAPDPESSPVRESGLQAAAPGPGPGQGPGPASPEVAQRQGPGH